MTMCYCGATLEKSNFEVMHNHPVYDSFNLPAGDQRRFHLFSVPMGMDGKEFVDTNMMMCGVLPMPRWFECESAQLILEKGSDQDFPHCFEVEFSIGGRRIFDVTASNLLKPIPLRETILQGQNFHSVFTKTSSQPLGCIKGMFVLNGTLSKEKDS